MLVGTVLCAAELGGIALKHNVKLLVMAIVRNGAVRSAIQAGLDEAIKGRGGVTRLATGQGKRSDAQSDRGGDFAPTVFIGSIMPVHHEK